MRAVIQRVHRAHVDVDGDVVGRIGPGLLVYVGVAKTDGPADARYVAAKVRDLRIFEDDTGRMNRSVEDARGSILVISQFTLYGDCRKGRRPSFDAAAPPDLARALYEDVVRLLRDSGATVETGSFRARMRVESVNDGPVTILIDSARQF